MFKLFLHGKMLSIDKNTNYAIYEYAIIDSDFEAKIAVNTGVIGSLIIAIVEEYERRNLSVAGNIVRLANYLQRDSNFDYLNFLRYYCFSLYEKYENEINKYLVLM